MGGALLREFGVRGRPRSVTCVHKWDWHLEWNTPGSPGRYAGKSNGLLSKYHRYHSLHIFRSRIRNQIENQIENQKKPNGPNQKYKREKTQKSTYLVPRVVLDLGWLMWCNVCISYERTYSQKQHCRGYSIQFVSYATPDHASLLYTNFVPTSISPTLYGLLYSVMFQFSTKRPMTLGPKIQQKKRRGCISMMTFADLELLQRWSPAGQLYIF